MKLYTIGLINRLFYDYRWEIAYRKISKDEPIVNTHDMYSYKILELPKGYWGADPFLLERNNEAYIFFEYTDIKKYKSVLAVKRIYPSIGDVHVIFEFDVHTSYPCIFYSKDNLYIIPETASNSTLQLLKCIEWPYKWEKICDLATNFKCVDTTPLFLNDSIYLVTYYRADSGFNLYGCKFDIENLKIESPRILKNYYQNIGRPGGHFINVNGNIIRIVQPATKFYGEQIDFYRINFNEVDYSEEKISEFHPEQIKIDKKLNIVGVHTYNRSDNFEVVDLRIEYKFDFFRPIKRIFQIFELFGYGLNDFRHKYINGKYPLHKK